MSLQYFKESALTTADMLLAQSRTAFQHGEIAQTELLLTLRQALTIREEYLVAHMQYNLSLITIYYLTGTK
jgi:outer membrane protein TolC